MNDIQKLLAKKQAIEQKEANAKNAVDAEAADQLLRLLT